jgi:hypothetical protein
MASWTSRRIVNKGVSGPDWSSELAELTWEGVCGDVRVGKDGQAGSPQ